MVAYVYLFLQKRRDLYMIPSFYVYLFLQKRRDFYMIPSFSSVDVIKISLQMQLSGERGSLVGMLSTVPYHLCNIYFDAKFTNLVLSILLMKPTRGQHLQKWLKRKGLDNYVWDLHQQ
jgi:hypothetical protein